MLGKHSASQATPPTREALVDFQPFHERHDRLVGNLCILNTSSSALWGLAVPATSPGFLLPCHCCHSPESAPYVLRLYVVSSCQALPCSDSET